MNFTNCLRLGLMGVLVSVSISVAGRADETTPLVTGEFAKQQNELQAQMTKAMDRLHQVQSERERAVIAAKLLAKAEAAAIESLRKYDILIEARYVSNDGTYQSGSEVSKKDVENLNKMFDGYLHSVPFQGRVSAGYARRTIAWGMARLDELSKTHSQPTEANNSELEIISQQLKDAEATVRIVTSLALRLGVSLNAAAVATSEHPGATTRGPASE